jgi:hypothetical protein
VLEPLVGGKGALGDLFALARLPVGHVSNVPLNRFRHVRNVPHTAIVAF